jgi:hypothetical protein
MKLSNLPVQYVFDLQTLLIGVRYAPQKGTRSLFARRLF